MACVLAVAVCNGQEAPIRSFHLGGGCTGYFRMGAHADIFGNFSCYRVVVSG